MTIKIGLLKRKRITIEEHKELGKELATMSRRLGEIYIDLYNRGYRHRKVLKSLYNANWEVNHLRCYLDDVFCAEYPVEFDTEVYYGKDSMGILM